LGRADQNVVARIEGMSIKERELLILELTYFANMLVHAKTRWIPRGILPRGHDGETLAMEALCRVLDGTRNWDPDKDPDFLGYLKSVVKSIFSHEVLDRGELEKAEISSVDADGIDLIETAPSPEPSQEEKLENAEFENRMLECLKDENEQMVLLCIFYGLSKPSEIAEQLDMDVKEVYRIKRRLERKLIRPGDGGNDAEG
jgi:RNA polymerase sigma factor (sigma-70 family)